MRELYVCCVRYFKEKMVIGCDQCYEIFRSNGLVQRKKRVRPKQRTPIIIIIYILIC